MKRIVVFFMFIFICSIVHAESIKERLKRAREEERRQEQTTTIKVDTSKSKIIIEGQKMNMGTCKDLGKKIASCRPYSCTSPHPLLPFSQVVHTVEGKKGTYCRYTQTMPNDGLMDCRLSKDSRRTFARDFATAVERASKRGECKVSGYEYVDKDNPGSKKEQCMRQKCQNCRESSLGEPSMTWYLDRECVECMSDRDCKEGLSCHDNFCK